MDGKVLGVERRRRWSKDEKSRIVEETLMPGAVVCEVARRHGVAQSLLFTWRRQARAPEAGGRDSSILLPVEIGAATPSGSQAARHSRAMASGRRAKSGVIEIAITQPLFFKRAFAVRTVVKPGRGRSRRRGSRP